MMALKGTKYALFYLQTLIDALKDYSTKFSSVDPEVKLAELKSRLDSGEPDLMDKDRSVALENIIHACDIGNPARPREVALEWTFRILDEFFSQGDKE